MLALYGIPINFAEEHQGFGVCAEVNHQKSYDHLVLLNLRPLVEEGD